MSFPQGPHPVRLVKEARPASLVLDTHDSPGGLFRSLEGGGSVCSQMHMCVWLTWTWPKYFSCDTDSPESYYILRPHVLYT